MNEDDYFRELRKFWCAVYAARVSSPDCQSTDNARLWADIATQRFEDRFRPVGIETDEDSGSKPPQ